MSFCEPVAGGTLAAGKNSGATLYSIGHLRFHFVSLRGSVKRPDYDALLQSISDSKLFNFAEKLRYKLVVDFLEKVKSFDGEARLAAVEEAADRCCADSLVNVGIIAHDHRVASAEFQSDTFHILRSHFHDVLSRRRSAREPDLPDTRVFQKRFTDDSCRTRNDVQHTRRKPRLVQNLYGMNTC